jgi:hypothetical protein
MSDKVTWRSFQKDNMNKNRKLIKEGKWIKAKVKKMLMN